MELRVRHADGLVQRVVLDAGKQLRFGTHPSAEVKLREPGAPSIAFGIVFKNGSFRVVPSKAAGSVPLNGHRVKKATLQPGDIVQIGETRVEVVGETTPLEEELPDLPPDILADDLLEADAAADPLSASSDSLLGDGAADLDDLSDPLADIPSDPIGAPAPPAAAGGQRKATRHKTVGAAPGGSSTFSRLVQTTWFQIALTSVVVVPLIVLIGIFFWQLPTDQQAFEEANTIYRAGDWMAAVQAFDKFLAWREDSPLAGDAQVKRDVAQLRIAFEQGQDASTLLDDVQLAIARWGALRRRSAAEEGLAQLLPPLVADLLREGREAARQSEAQVANAAFSRSREALHLIYQFVPPKLQQQHGVDELLTQLTSQRREFNQPAELREAIHRVDAAGAEGGIEHAYFERLTLLEKHPDLLNNGRLAASMRAVARAEAGRVAFKEDAVEEPEDDRRSEPAVEVQVLFANGPVEGKPAAAADKLAFVKVVSSNAMFAIDPSSLTVAWRYVVGSTDALPVRVRDVAGRAVILLDQNRQGLVRLEAASGEEVWYQPIAHAAGQPRLAAGQVIVATQDGRLLTIDTASGSVAGSIRFPQNLRVGPTLFGSGERLVQVGDHSIIYLISLAAKQCLDAFYLGHELGSVTVAPVVSAGHVFVLEKVDPQKSTLHVLRLGEHLQKVTSISIDGLATTAPVFYRQALYVATTNGQVHVVRHAPEDKRRPFRLAGTVPLLAESAVQNQAVYLATTAGRIWAGGCGLAVLEPASGDSLPRTKRLDDQLVVHQPLDTATVTNGVICAGVHRGPGSVVQRWDEQQVMAASAVLGNPSAGSPLVAAERDRMWNLTRNGRLYKVDCRDLVETSTSHHIVVPVERLSTMDRQVDYFEHGLVGSNYGVFASQANHGKLIFVPWSAEGTIRTVALSGPLAGPAVPMGAAWMMAVKHGAIGLIDPATGEISEESFLPPTSSNAALQWSRPVVTSDQRAVVYDGNGTLFSIRHSGGLRKLDVDVAVTLESPLLGELVHVGRHVWSVSQGGQLIAFNVSSLKTEGTIDLPARLEWGPKAVAGKLLLTTTDGSVSCVGDGMQTQWQARFHHGPVVGACSSASDQLVFAARGGVVWRVNVETGETIGDPVALRQPLAYGPLRFGDRLCVGSADGTLLILRSSFEEGAGVTEVGAP